VRTKKTRAQWLDQLGEPNSLDDMVTLQAIEPTYREIWALPLAAGASILGLMNIVANVPKPDEAVASCLPAGVMLLLAALLGFLGVTCSGSLHRVTIARQALRSARRGMNDPKGQEALDEALRGVKRRYAGWGTAYVCFTLGSAALLIGAWSTLTIGFLSGGRLQP
jgi:hypothetical protein